MDQITLHEVTVGSNALKLGNLTNFIEKKIEGVLAQMKSIYDDTISQNHRTTHALEEMVGPINQQLKNKVDSDTYNKHVGQILAAIGGGVEDLNEDNVERGLMR